MFKIKSRFYVIYGDYKPIYVGYTNRTVKQRFQEHKRSKDFSDYDLVEVKELKDQLLSFDFTWNYEQTCKNAQIVSDREASLVNKYNTQDSCYQKADGGGQTWAIEKWFVKSNKDNPRFAGLSGTEIKSQIETERAISEDITSFVNHMRPQYQVDITSFVNHMRPQYQVDITSFVNHMRPQYQVDISTFVNDMKLQYQSDISHFVNDMKLQYQSDISHFVSTMKPQYQVDIHSFVSTMKPQYQVDIHNFVNNMKWRA